MKVQKRTMNWLPRASAWAEAQAQRSKRRSSIAQGIASTEALSSTLSGVREAQSSGLAEIAVRRAAARLNLKA
jgi:hypothetical protein